MTTAVADITTAVVNLSILVLRPAGLPVVGSYDGPTGPGRPVAGRFLRRVGGRKFLRRAEHLGLGFDDCLAGAW